MATLQTPFLKQAVSAITTAKPLDVAGGCFSPDNIQTTGEVLDASINETQHQYQESRRSNDSISSESSDSTSIKSTRSITSESSLESSDTITEPSVKNIISSEETTQDTSPVTQGSSGNTSRKGSRSTSCDPKVKIRRQERLELKQLELKEQDLDEIVKTVVEVEQARRESVQEAVGLIKNFVMGTWETECENGHVKITCDVTMNRMMEIGRLEQKDGWQECLKLVKAPVIHDAIGLGLWQELAKQVLIKDALEKAAREKAALEEAALEKAALEKAASEEKMAVIKRSPGDLFTGTDAHKRKREGSIQHEERRAVPRLATKSDQIESAPADEQDSSNSDVPTSLVKLNQGTCPTCKRDFEGIIRRDEEQDKNR
ncbi:hypothetical protein CGCF415_v010614 [Colletotrichum fructicola]|nr:uncharacterized protein CGMCC3_g15135 [Colletotrichum fructicola]KAE9568779.1 hypothetical protein CGMCC3_g15135 [Colletotrichum fructicola]KAF4431930.1 hypothetical protein CFRS1_v012529 [Colletotrichum fructicola]KAF4899019.1 hypothetical protein CGCF415_v010614 [Colletotrichum fructicola]KAF4932384.1 hypothetical protein CGCF245_v010661 [Colletotrichum fructicola]KAF5509144.1 hypothetical protein CGCF413_v002177 [Colletotrichum fructicola]